MGLSRPWLGDFFGEDLAGWLGMRERLLPAVNVCEDEKNYQVDVVAPGLRKEDFRINVDQDHILTISGESSQQTSHDGKQYNRKEYSYSSFARSFYLPENAKEDGIDARYSDGVLRLNIPKTENRKSEKPMRQIQVK